MWWVFVAANALASIQAQSACFSAMPQDTLYGGKIAPIQYTVRWDGVNTLTDGRLAFQACPGTAMPGSVSTTMTYAQINPLLQPNSVP